MLSFFIDIYSWFNTLSSSDWILLVTFIAIVLYTIETFKLRKWQQKSVQISILNLRQQILMHQDEMHSKNSSMDRNINNADIVNIMNDILEKGEFDLRRLYAPGIIQTKKNWLKKLIDR